MSAATDEAKSATDEITDAAKDAAGDVTDKAADTAKKKVKTAIEGC